MKKQGTERMILSMVELFANIKYFGFYIKLSSGQLIFDVVSSDLYLIFQMKQKNEKAFNILFSFVTFCFKTVSFNKCLKFVLKDNISLKKNVYIITNSPFIYFFSFSCLSLSFLNFII